jgi:prepilin-type N-terminal cleavage/methylation domain-containing protein
MRIHVTKFGLAGSRFRREISAMKGARGSRRGFTLVEVMVLLVIIAFLLAMAIMALQKIRQTRQEKAVTTTGSTIPVATSSPAP